MDRLYLLFNLTQTSLFLSSPSSSQCPLQAWWERPPDFPGAWQLEHIFPPSHRGSHDASLNNRQRRGWTMSRSTCEGSAADGPGGEWWEMGTVVEKGRGEGKEGEKIMVEGKELTAPESDWRETGFHFGCTQNDQQGWMILTQSLQTVFSFVCLFFLVFFYCSFSKEQRWRTGKQTVCGEWSLRDHLY